MSNDNSDQNPKKDQFSVENTKVISERRTADSRPVKYTPPPHVYQFIPDYSMLSLSKSKRKRRKRDDSAVWFGGNDSKSTKKMRKQKKKKKKKKKVVLGHIVLFIFWLYRKVASQGLLFHVNHLPIL